VPSAGQLDPTFGTGGIVNTNIGGPTPTTAKAVVVTQSDGKVVVAGTSYDSYGGGNRVAVVRYNTDGSLDSTFGSKGEVTFNFTTLPSSYNSDTPAGLAVDASGHIIVAGTTNPAGNPQLAVARLNSNGSFDTTFGSGGETIVPRQFSNGNSQYENDYAASVALDTSGHIVLAGTAQGLFSGSYGYRFAVARLNADGSLDSGFGSGGETTVSPYTTDSFEFDTAAGVALDSAGHIVVAGNTLSYPSGGHFAVTRLNSDGSLDTNFGSGGKVIVAPNFSSSSISEYDTAAGVAIDSSGRIDLAGTANGYFSGSYGSRFAVARLNANGSFDSGFGSGGETTVSTYGTNTYEVDTAAGVALDSAGHIVVAGTTSFVSFAPGTFAVTRLNNDGSLDSGFGSGGKTTVIYPGYANNSAAVVALDASGRVVLAGTLYSSQGMAVTRLNTDGSLDASWGNGGRVTTAIPGPSNDSATNMTVTQPDGKIVVVGTSYAQNNIAGVPGFRLAVTRYNPDGSLDSTFGQGGVALFAANYGVFFLSPSAVTLDGSGRIVIAGTSPSSTMAVVRLNADGSLDTSLAGSGEAFVPRFSTGPNFYEEDSVSGVAIDTSGHIVLAGSASGYGGGARFAVARLNADGSLDSSFGSGGQTTVGYSTSSYEYDFAAGVVLDTSGHIVVAGTSLDYANYSAGQHVAVTRLNANGSLDGSFGSGGKTTISFNGGFGFDNVAGVGLDPSGRIVVAGNTLSIFGTTFAVARLNAADGSLDQSFGTGGVSTVGGFNNPYFGGSASRMAIDAAGRIAVVGSVGVYGGSDFAVALFEANGSPDVDFGTDGKVTTSAGSGSFDSFDSAAGAAFDPAGRLVVAGTSYGSGRAYSDFTVIRYLPHDPVVQAGSATFASDLQAAVTALRTTPPAGTPRVVIHVASQAQMAAVLPALASLSGTAGPEIEVLVDADQGTYNLGSVSVPAGLKLILDGEGGVGGTRTFTGSSAPALTLLSGDVVIRGGEVLSSTGNASTIVVQGGQLTVRNSTIQETTTTAGLAAIAISGGLVDLGTSANPFDPNYGGNSINVTGPGHFIRLTGPNNVLAFGDFNYNSDNFSIEDLIDHSLDGLGGGTVFWVPNNVFVTVSSGSVQRGINVVPTGGTVNVQLGVKGNYYVGSELLTVAYQNGPTITQQADTLDATKRELLVSDVNTPGSNNIKFVAGTNPGEVQLNFNNLLQGTFLPTGRLVAHAYSGDNVTVDSTLTLSAWLYADGDNVRLKGGSGNNVLIGNGAGDLLAGGAGRSLLIGTGADKLVSNGGQDILLAGSTSYDANEVALAAIMAEWTSADSLATRIADLTDNTASPYFTGGLNAGYFLLDSGPNQTVYSDSSADTITAGSGPDWIFAGSADKISGLTAADLLFIFGS
jgi:uncharacterized delta-60 repeat protein